MTTVFPALDGRYQFFRLALHTALIVRYLSDKVRCLITVYRKYNLVIKSCDLRNIVKNLHGKNGFAEVSKNLARCKSENNFVWIIKIIM